MQSQKNDPKKALGIVKEYLNSNDINEDIKILVDEVFLPLFQSNADSLSEAQSVCIDNVVNYIISIIKETNAPNEYNLSFDKIKQSLIQEDKLDEILSDKNIDIIQKKQKIGDVFRKRILATFNIIHDKFNSGEIIINPYLFKKNNCS